MPTSRRISYTAKHADAKKWVVDRFLAASRLRRDGVIGYHSALELHGCAYTEGHIVHVIAHGEPGMLETLDFRCKFIKPPRGFESSNSVTVVDRLGLDVRLTSIERTIVDSFDRYDLSGGPEELFNSLDLVARIDPTALVRHARSLANATAVGAIGFWLEREQHRLGVPDATIQSLRKLAPNQARYALGSKTGEGKTATGWNVILPRNVIERRFEGL